MSSLSVIFVVFVEFLAITRESNASCSNIHADINSTQVATVCTDNVVTGSSVFIDTSHARNMLLTPGYICTCHAQLGEGTFHVSANFTDNTDSSSCGTYLQFHTDVFSSNISCATNTLDSVFQNITNMTAEFHIVSESMNGGYCVQLEQAGVICIEGQVPCDDHQACISVDQRCDRKEDCPDGSDESLTYCENGTAIKETSPVSEKSYITITCLKLPASQVSTTTPVATAPPTTSNVKTTTHHTDSTAATPATITPSTASPSPLTTTPHTDSTLTVTYPPDTSDDNIGLILGIVFGILAPAVVVIGVAVYCWRKYAKVKKHALCKFHKRVLGHTGKGSQNVTSAQPGQDYVNTRVTMSEVQAGHD